MAVPLTPASGAAVGVVMMFTVPTTSKMSTALSLFTSAASKMKVPVGCLVI